MSGEQIGEGEYQEGYADPPEPVPIRKEPPAANYLEAAARKAGFKRTGEWASDVLNNAARTILEGPNALEVDWRKQAEAWKERAARLRTAMVIEMARILITRPGNELTREQALQCAIVEIDKIESGQAAAESKKIVVVKR
jgi:hypothetical protein